MPLLRVEDLSVTFPGAARPAVDGVSFEVRAGEGFGIVGASGSGKSQTLFSIVRLPPPGARLGGRVFLDGEELLAAPEAALRRVRGARIGVVFQEPLAALAPFLTIGDQLADVARRHLGLSRAGAAARAVELLRAVELPDPEDRARRYPHELSGGQRQRAAIAVALAGEPALLLADEPTTALDTTVQAGVLALLARLRRERGLALVLVGHDLDVVASACETVAVLFAGRLVERGPSALVLGQPRHPYTAALVAAAPAGRVPAATGGSPGPGSRPEGGTPGSLPLEALAGGDLAPAPAPGCPFRHSCPRADAGCAAGPVPLAVDGARLVACRRPLAPGEAA